VWDRPGPRRLRGGRTAANGAAEGGDGGGRLTGAKAGHAGDERRFGVGGGAPPATDEQNWKVPNDRVNSLAQIATKVNAAAGNNWIVYYPGSGADIANPLFATHPKASVFVFADPGLTADQIEGGFPSGTAIRDVTLTVPAGVGIGKNAHKQAGGAMWTFSFKGVARTLIFAKQSSDAFLNAHRDFKYHVFFEKDFAATDAENPDAVVLPRLQRGGMFMSNAGDQLVVEDLLPMLGLTATVRVPNVGFNDMVVRTKTVERSAEQLKRGDELLKAMKTAATMLLFSYYEVTDFDRVLHLTEQEWIVIFGIALRTATGAGTPQQRQGFEEATMAAMGVSVVRSIMRHNDPRNTRLTVARQRVLSSFTTKSLDDLERLYNQGHR
jgi:hypothetical protein